MKQSKRWLQNNYWWLQYVGELSRDDWKKVKVETQFQSEALSHEHAALLLTETITYSLNVNKLPLFCLLLDAKSAFYRALREILNRQMFLDGNIDHSLSYLVSRLKNISTVLEWDKEFMGPIQDEQGNFNSSEQYKLYNNKELVFAQESNLGVMVGPL